MAYRAHFINYVLAIALSLCVISVSSPSVTAANADSNKTVLSSSSETYGWKTVDGKKYYIKKDGTYVNSNATINGVRYKFAKDGVCLGKFSGFSIRSGNKYYYKNGILKKGWFIRKNKKYYADEVYGRVATDTYYIIDGFVYHFDKQGVWDGTKITYKEYMLSLRSDSFGGIISEVNVNDHTMDIKYKNTIKVRTVDKDSFEKFLDKLNEYKEYECVYAESENDCGLPDIANIVSGKEKPIIVRFKKDNITVHIMIMKHCLYYDGDSINSWYVITNDPEIYEMAYDILKNAQK